MEKVQPDISDEAIKAKTGRDWAEWLRVVDDFGGASMTHKQIARKLNDDKLIDPDSPSAGWWAQSVTVGYEKLKGRRVLGQTADAGFEVGVHKTVYRPNTEVWELILSPDGLREWLGDMPELVLAKKQPYQTTDGTSGEVRSFKEGQMIRLTWQPKGRREPTTLQMRTHPVMPDKTRLSFHHEKLASAAEREAMRQRWQQAAAAIDQLANK